jgi:hypothetical protein
VEINAVNAHRRILRKWVSVGLRRLALVGVGTEVIRSFRASATAAGVVGVERLSWKR